MKKFKILLIESSQSSKNLHFDKLFKTNPEYILNLSIVQSIADAHEEIEMNLFDAVVFHSIDEKEVAEIINLKVDIPIFITKIQGREHLFFQLLKSGIVDFIDVPENPLGILPIIIEKAIMHKKNELNNIRLAAIVDSSDDAIFSRTTQGKILTWNPGAEKIFGYTSQEAIGQSLSIITSPEQASEVAQIMQKVLNEEPVHNLETKRKRKDGKFLNVSVSVAPMRDTAGKITGLSNIIRDISEQKATEEKAKMMAMIVKASEDAIISCSLEGLIQTWNPSAESIFGYTAEESIGQHISKITPDEKINETMSFISRVAAGEHIKNIETIRLKKNGQRITVAMSLAPIKDSFDNVTALSGIIRDITKRVKLEQHQIFLMQQLEKKNQELNHFVYLASHDLKAPLRAIGSISHWLQNDYADKLDEAGRTNLELIVGRVTRLDRLINAIQQYTEINTDVSDVDTIDLNAFIQKILQSLNTPSSIKIEIDPLPEIVFSISQLEQVFSNLLINAIEYIDKPEGIIKICFEDMEQYWIFSVTDNGCGIEERYLEKIFQIFQSLSSRDQKESTGIGLSIVKKIIELYHGRIWVKSTPGSGTTVYFTISKKLDKNIIKEKVFEMAHA